MREIFEFRVGEKYAGLLFEPDEGVPLGDSILGVTVRKVAIRTDDPRFRRIGEIQDELRRTKGEPFYTGWYLYHYYTKAELRSAEFFHLNITGVFEPSGIDCGTQYDYSESCPECGCPARQTTDLILDLRKAPKTRDIAMTIHHNEWIVSQHLAGLIVNAGLTGFDLAPVRHKGWYEDDAMEFRAVHSGRELLRRAEQAGCPHGTLEFWTWLNRAEQRELSERMKEEWVTMRTERERRRGKPLPVWYQVITTSPCVTTVAPTRFGIDPFDDDPQGDYRCSRLDWDKRGEHIAGCNVLSELFIDRDSYDGRDIVRTREHKGWPTRIAKQAGAEHGEGVPFLLISPRFRQLLIDNGIRGWKTEVSYLC